MKNLFKYFLCFIFLLYSSPALAATKTLCASGCDYTSCASWVTYLQGLSSGTGVLTEPEILEVRESVSTSCSISTGITTSASNYWEIKGWSTCKHSGLYAASKCEITSTGANQTVFISAQGYWRITDMIISNTGSASGGNPRKGLRAESLASGEARITNTIFHKTGGGTDTSNAGCDVAINGSGTYKVVVANSESHDWVAQGFIFDVRDLDTLVFYNNTAHGNNVGLHVNGTNGSTETCRLKNNLLDTNTTADYEKNSGSDCATQTLTENWTSDATGTDISKNPTYVNEAGNDFRLDTGSEGIDGGSDLSADGDYAVTDDIIGTARPQGAAFDVGMFELTAGGATNHAIVILHGIGAL